MQENLTLGAGLASGWRHQARQVPLRLRGAITAERRGQNRPVLLL